MKNEIPKAELNELIELVGSVVVEFCVMLIPLNNASANTPQPGVLAQTFMLPPGISPRVLD